MKNAQILNLLEELPEKRIDSKRFGDIFRIDGISLWHFLRPLMHSSFLPKPFKSEWEIEKEIGAGKIPSLSDKLKFSLSGFAMRKAFAINEEIKFLISRHGKGDLSEIRKKNVLFIAPTNQISEINGKLEFLEVGRILNSLKRKKIKLLVLVYDPFFKNSFFKLNRYGPLLYDYTTPEILKQGKRVSLDLHKKWKTLDEKSKKELFTYEGKSYWKFFKSDMDILFSRELLSTLVKCYLTLKEVLEKHEIKVVYLTGLSNFYELSALGAVYKLGGKVVYSSHGYARYAPGAWEFMKNVLFAAGGEEHRRNLLMGGMKEESLLRGGMLRGGIKKENIFLTGFPFFDEIAYLKRGGAPRAKKTVTLLTTVVVESRFMEKKKYFDLIHETLAQIKNVKQIGKVIIKLHPQEKFKSEYESIAKSLGLKNIEVIQEPGKASLYSVINDSDLLVGFGSTAVLEGLMFGKDAIHLEMLEAMPVFEFKKATFCVKKIDEVAEAIKKVLTDKRARKKLKTQRERYLRQAFYAIDGKAHERVANLIASRVKKK